MIQRTSVHNVNTPLENIRWLGSASRPPNPNTASSASPQLIFQPNPAQLASPPLTLPNDRMPQQPMPPAFSSPLPSYPMQPLQPLGASMHPSQSPMALMQPPTQYAPSGANSFQTVPSNMPPQPAFMQQHMPEFQQQFQESPPAAHSQATFQPALPAFPPYVPAMQPTMPMPQVPGNAMQFSTPAAHSSAVSMHSTMPSAHSLPNQMMPSMFVHPPSAGAMLPPSTSHPISAPPHNVYGDPMYGAGPPAAQPAPMGPTLMQQPSTPRHAPYSVSNPNTPTGQQPYQPPALSTPYMQRQHGDAFADPGSPAAHQQFQPLSASMPSFQPTSGANPAAFIFDVHPGQPDYFQPTHFDSPKHNSATQAPPQTPVRHSSGPGNFQPPSAPATPGRGSDSHGPLDSTPSGFPPPPVPHFPPAVPEPSYSPLPPPPPASSVPMVGASVQNTNLPSNPAMPTGQPQGPPSQPQRRHSFLEKFRQWKANTRSAGPPTEQYYSPAMNQITSLSSQVGPHDPRHIDPLPLLVPVDDAKKSIKRLVMSSSGGRIFVDDGNYLRFEIYTPAHRAVDEVELLFDAPQGIVHILLQQTSGPCDPQAARLRVHELYTKLQADAPQPPNIPPEMARPNAFQHTPCQYHQQLAMPCHCNVPLFQPQPFY